VRSSRCWRWCSPLDRGGRAGRWRLGYMARGRASKETVILRFWATRAPLFPAQQKEQLPPNSYGRIKHTTKPNRRSTNGKRNRNYLENVEPVSLGRRSATSPKQTRPSTSHFEEGTTTSKLQHK
jgi:hypothetical protein